jgi:DNA-directed RNA polymerase beta' subunit
LRVEKEGVAGWLLKALPAHRNVHAGRTGRDQLSLRPWELARYLRALLPLNPLAEAYVRMEVERATPLRLRQEPKRADSSWRRILPPYLGRLCPVATPENDSIGITMQFASGAVVDQKGTIYATYIDARTGETAQVGPAQETERWVGERLPQGEDKVLARRLQRDGSAVYAYKGRREVEYALRAPEDILSLAASLIPFIQHNDAVRAIMGAKLLKEALPLREPETPLVATGLEEEVLAAAPAFMAMLKAPAAGQVISVDNGEITIETSHGPVRIPLLQGSVPEKANAAVLLRPRVKVGDRVDEGQVIADGPGMRDGRLALGVNLLVAYVPFQGLNFEDGIVISETASRKLTSVHLYRIELTGVEVERQDKGKASHGLVKPGTKVVGGDVVAVIRRKPQVTSSGLTVSARPATEEELRQLAEYFRSGRPAAWSAPEDVVVPEEVEDGEVVRAELRNDHLSIWIYEERPARVGDKIAGRHGNKGVITCVLPDDHMPYFEANGETYRVEAILNPMGVVSRMNLGQLLETHWGWVLKNYNGVGSADLGRPFAGARADELERLLQQTGLDGRGKAQLYDGRTKQPFHQRSVVGYQYFLRLPQIAGAVLAGRARKGPRSLRTEQPVPGRRAEGGQRLGEMEVWALRAHGACANLKEALGPRSDDRQAALDPGLSMGQPLPPRKSPETLKAVESLARGALLHLCLPDRPEGAAQVSWLPAESVPTISQGEVNSPSLADSARQGLYSEDVFGWSRSDRRSRLGHITLACPIIHPWRWPQVRRSLVGSALAGGANKGTAKRLRRKLDALWRWEDRNDEGGTNAVLKWAQEQCPAQLKEIEKAMIQVLPVVPPAYRWRYVEGHRCHLDPLAAAYQQVIWANSRYRFLAELNPSCLAEMLASKGSTDSFIRWLHWKLNADVSLREVYQRGDFQALKDALERRYRRSLHRAVLRLFHELRRCIDGKYGLLRYDLLGKRVDYSGRAVIVPAPDLRLNECNVPIGLLWELLEEPLRRRIGYRRYYRLGEAVRTGRRRAIKAAAGHLERLISELDLRVLLNRPPTLHKYNLLAFRPRPWYHKVIGFPPLYCGPYNADFDGDAMALFLPVSTEAQAEAREVMDVSRHLHSAASGELLLHLTQDVVLGCYYLGLTSADPEVESWKEELWQQLGKVLELEAERRPMRAQDLKRAVADLVTRHKDSPDDLLDRLRQLSNIAFEAATRSGVSLSYFDLKPFIVPEDRRHEWVKFLETGSAGARITEERLRDELDNHLSAVARDHGEEFNPLVLIYGSGARGSWEQILQTIGFKGRAVGEKEELIILNNLYEGLSPFQFYMSCHGARASLVDKKINVAKGGHITRELAESCGHIRIDPEVEDCGATEGIPVPLTRAVGRFLAEELGHCPAGQEVTSGIVHLVRQADPAREFAVVRSPATCRLDSPWICRKCYGRRPPGSQEPLPGEEVGILAAQSIGERGTQLSMRTFHAGGMAYLDLEWARRLLLAGRRRFDWVGFWQELYRPGSPYVQVDPRHFEVALRPRLLRQNGSWSLKAAADVSGDSGFRGFLSAAAYRDAVRVLVEAADRGLQDQLWEPKGRLMLNLI